MTNNKHNPKPMMRGTDGTRPRNARSRGRRRRDFSGTMKRLLRYIKPYSLSIFFGILFAATTVMTVVGPKILGMATTELAAGLSAKAMGQGRIDFGRIAEILIFLLCLYGLSAVFHYFQNWLMAGVAQKVSSTTCAERWRRKSTACRSNILTVILTAICFPARPTTSIRYRRP